ncbi:AtSec20 [Arabidopsis thaliana]|uniref:AtSec20 n=1 Tax=Arabidopsis thaliana TaxID=3702 RepID=A0A178VM55_ARATH|nr:AtSec20 [Arabidopsis thaliana]
MDEVVVEVEKTKREWEEAYEKTIGHIISIQQYGKSRRGDGGEEKFSLQRLNGLAQDGLSLLNSLQFNLDLLAPQLPSDDQVQSTQSLLETWKNQYHSFVTVFVVSLRVNLRSANLQAKDNMRKAAQEERELLLGGGTESTVLRRKRQANADVTSDAESITESLRRSRQLMVQEVERSTNTLVAFDESTGVLKKAESEYKGHRSLLSRTRNLLSTMQRQDVIDRIILIVGFSLFVFAVVYVVSKRIGILKLQRMATAAIKAQLAGKAANGVGDDVMPLGQQFDGNTVPTVNIPLQQRMHDEL